MLLKFYKIYAFHQVISSKDYLANEKVSIVSASTINGEFVSFGNKKTPMMWKSSIITNRFYNSMLFVQEYQNGRKTFPYSSRRNPHGGVSQAAEH